MYFDPIHFYYSCLTPCVIYNMDAIESYFAFVLWNSHEGQTANVSVCPLLQWYNTVTKSSLWRKEFVKHPSHSPSRREVRVGIWGQELKQRLWKTGLLAYSLVGKTENLLVAQPQRLTISAIPITHWRPGRFLDSCWSYLCWNPK